VVKWKFITVAPPGKMLLATTWKNQLIAPPGKNISQAHASSPASASIRHYPAVKFDLRQICVGWCSNRSNMQHAQFGGVNPTWDTRSGSTYIARTNWTKSNWTSATVLRIVADFTDSSSVADLNPANAGNGAENASVSFSDRSSKRTVLCFSILLAEKAS